MQEKEIRMNRVCLSKPVATTNVQLDLDLFAKLKTVTNNYNICYNFNNIGNYYVMFIHFNTCKDILDLIKLFGEDYDISLRETKKIRRTI